MSVSRRDFEAVAKVLQDEHPNRAARGVEPWETHERIVNGLAEYFGEQNPNFDRERFYKAVEG